MTSPSVDDFTGYNKTELADMCRANDISGHSKKSPSVLIEMLIKAGIHPVKKCEVAKKERAVTKSTEVAKAIETATTAAVVSKTSHTTNTTNTTHEYIFHADWSNVLQYLDASCVQLIIADGQQGVQGDTLWLSESLRVLETDGTILVHGMTNLPLLPKEAHASWIPVGTDKILAIRKDTEPVEATMETLQGVYNEFVEMTRTDATVLLPFAGNGETCKLVRKYRRSFIAMESDKESVSRLYSLIK